MENTKRKSINSAEKSARLSIRIMKYFQPIHGHTNPLWSIFAPFFTSAYAKTDEFQKHMPSIEAEMKKRGATKKDLFRDMAYSTFVFGTTNDEYIDYDFYHQSNDYRSRFFTVVKNYKMALTLNGSQNNELFNNKAKHMEKFPEWYCREWAVLGCEEDIPSCVDFLNRHSQCVLKPDDGFSGAGIRFLDKEKTADASALFQDALKEGKWVLDERIVQHPFMMEIYPHSVNTVRFHTMLGKNGKVRIFYPYLRMGRGGAAVDNYSAGGLAVPVDTETGVIFGKTSCALPNEGGTTHPDTGCQLIGRQIPQWEEVKQMLGEMARACPQLRYLGWDMALSAQHGWTLVEVNAAPGTTEWRSIENYGMAQEYADLQRWALEGYHDDVLPHGQVEV